MVSESMKGLSMRSFSSGSSGLAKSRTVGAFVYSSPLAPSSFSFYSIQRYKIFSYKLTLEFL